jgi:AmmeMemoRadiSam system protein A
MPHAPVLIPALAGERLADVSATVNALREVARHVVQSRPDTLVVISPHGPRRRHSFGVWDGAKLTGDLARFCAPEISVSLPNDVPLATGIAEKAETAGIATWFIGPHELDHGAVVPLWFLVEAGWAGPLVVLSLATSGLNGDFELGEAISAAATRLGRQVAVIASGDMSHCLTPTAPGGYDSRAALFDRNFIQNLRRGDLPGAVSAEANLVTAAGEDVIESTAVACASVRWNATGHRVLSYEGPFGVGYGVAILYEAPAGTPAAGRAEPAGEAGAFEFSLLPEIARRSLAAAFAGQGEQPPEGTGILNERKAVFVTLRQADGQLRGCMGTIEPRYRNVLTETWEMARAAAFDDRRFPPLKADELAALRIEVSIMHPPEPVGSPGELDPMRYGVIVRALDGRHGLLLPGLPGVGSVECQLALARRKGGISPDEEIEIQRFEVDHQG